jgi:hypothetical protein
VIDMPTLTTLEALVILKFLLEWFSNKAKEEGYAQADLDAADAKREEIIKKLLETNPPT